MSSFVQVVISQSELWYGKMNHLELRETLTTLLSELIYVSSQRYIFGEAIWSQAVNSSSITYQTKKLRPQSIMVETT